MIVVLTRPENSKSAVKLGYPCFTEANKGQIPRDAKVVRWGNGLSGDVPSWPLVLNKAAIMAVSTDKLAALRSVGRVTTVPELYASGEAAQVGTKIVVRPATHSEGSDFELVTTPRNYRVPEGYHGTEFIPDTREYRVWFVRDKYLVAKRIPRTSEGQTPDEVCRSKWGYSFLEGCFDKLREAMGLARQAIPLDFGAADFLWTDDFRGTGQGKWVFLEFNSAPSLDHDKVLRHFQTHLVAILGAQTSNPVVEVPAPTVRRVADVPTRNYVPINTTDGTSEAGSWESRYEAKLRAERAAKEKAIRDRVYGDI